jgi:hypothetical protein
MFNFDLDHNQNSSNNYDMNVAVDNALFDFDKRADAQNVSTIKSAIQQLHEMIESDAVDDMADLLVSPFITEKVAAPETVGTVYDYRQAGALHDQHPLTLAMAVRRRTLAK